MRVHRNARPHPRRCRYCFDIRGRDVLSNDDKLKTSANGRGDRTKNIEYIGRDTTRTEK